MSTFLEQVDKDDVAGYVGYAAGYDMPLGIRDMPLDYQGYAAGNVQYWEYKICSCECRIHR